MDAKNTEGRKEKETVHVFESDHDTKSRILDTATKLFALNGFKAVTLKDIAQSVGIKIASIYYYYADKDALIADVVSRFEDVYSRYHSWLMDKNATVASVDDLIANLFNDDFFNELDPVVRMGMSMLVKEQHHSESANRAVLRHIYEDAIENVKNGFDRLVDQGIVPPSDTKTLATIFMFCVITGNEIQLYEDMGMDLPIDIGAVYSALKILVAEALTQGVLPRVCYTQT